MPRYSHKLNYTNPPLITDTGLTGDSLPFDNRKPFLAVNYIISLLGVFPTSSRRRQLHEEGDHHRNLQVGSPFVGEIAAAAFNFAPAGWMLCEGQLLSIAGNEVLYQLLGTTYVRARWVGWGAETHANESDTVSLLFLISIPIHTIVGRRRPRDLWNSRPARAVRRGRGAGGGLCIGRDGWHDHRIRASKSDTRAQPRVFLLIHSMVGRTCVKGISSLQVPDFLIESLIGLDCSRHKMNEVGKRRVSVQGDGLQGRSGRGGMEFDGKI